MGLHTETQTVHRLFFLLRLHTDCRVMSFQQHQTFLPSTFSLMNLHRFVLDITWGTTPVLSWPMSAFVALRASEIWLLMSVWLGWNYTPLCWSQLLCFLSSPRVILPRASWFIEWLHCNSYMVEGPMAQITRGYYVLKARPQQCNKKCLPHSWMGPLIWHVCFFSVLFTTIKYRHVVFIESGQTSDQYFSSSLLSFYLSLPRALLRGMQLWYTLIKLRFPFNYIIMLPNCYSDPVVRQSGLLKCLFVSMCTRCGSCWLHVSYQIVGWREMKANSSTLWSSRP